MESELASKISWCSQMTDYIQNVRHDKEQNYCALFQHSVQYQKINYVNLFNHSLFYQTLEKCVQVIKSFKSVWE